MKRNFKLFFQSSLFVFLFLLLFLLKLNAESTIPFFDPLKTVSMDFKNAGLKDVLKALSIQSGLNFIAAENVEDRQITLYLDRVPLKNTMDNLFKANNLYYELDKDSNTFIVKSWGKPEVETVTKVFYLKYASVSSSHIFEEVGSSSASTTSGTSTTSTTTGTTGGTTSAGRYAVASNIGITTAVEKLLSEHGAVIEDYRTNSLIVQDIPSRIPVIAKTIAAIDVPTPQVLIEVEMLDVSKNIVDKLGFEFGENPITMILPGWFARRGADFFLGTLADKGKNITSSDVAGKLILGSTFAQTLNFLRTQTDTKLLARPRILTLNNETAEIKIVTNETVGSINTTSTGGGQTPVTTIQTERVETGVSLKVTPQINLETGEITMFILPTVKDTSTSTLSGVTAKDPEERSTRSIVRVKDGNTVMMGGLIRHQYSQVTKKLPILGDLPLVGALFRNKSKEPDKERELIVFITPHIIKEGMELAQAKNATLPAREQGTASEVKRELAINAGLNSFERKKK